MKIRSLDLRINQYVCFVICMALMVVIPIVRDNKFLGLNVREQQEEFQTVTVNGDDTYVINTTEIGKDIIGYGGPTPMKITVADGRIKKIEPLENRETPEFFGAVTNSDILDSYEGKTLEEAAALKPDAVSGATYSSNAVIATVKQGVNYVLDPANLPHKEKEAGESDFNLLKFIITIAVILCGAVIPLFLRNRNYRTAQLVVNVLILGFWGGTFISYSLMVSLLTNGFTKLILIPAALMLVTAFIYPMFGKANHYCLWLCPYGSLQELLGKIWKRKLQLSARTVKVLAVMRDILWFALMWLLWTGLWFDWMGYEPFAAFFFTDASAVVLGIAGAFLLLSVFIQRPYCRFVCPTGCLFKFAEGSRN